MAIIDGQLLSDTQRHAARNDSDLMHRVGIRQLRRDQRMTGLVVCSDFLFLVGKDHRLAFHAHQDFVFGDFEVIHQHGLAILPRCCQCRLVDHVSEVSAGESRSAAGEYGKIDILGKRNLAGMNAQNLFAPANIRTAHDHAPVKASRPE